MEDTQNNNTQSNEPVAKTKQMPRKGQDNPILFEKALLADAMRGMCSAKQFAADQGVAVQVLKGWVEYHGLDLPSKNDMSVARFYASVELNEETQCWNWTGKDTLSFDGKPMKPERFALAVIAGRGNLGKKRIVHTCGNMKCVNPDHLALLSELELVTANEVAQPEDAVTVESAVEEVLTETAE